MTNSARRRELVCVVTLAAILMCFTWHGVTMFFSGDDLMNMYNAWATPALKIWKAQVLPWMPLYRPLGTAVYRVFYTVFGFHPLPLYVFCWLLLIGNVFAAWRFFRALTPSIFVALAALSLTLVHAGLQDLYLSAGTVYDRLCFFFTVLAVIVYARGRNEEKGMSAGRVALLCFICMMAMNSKESGAAVPAILFCYECVYCLPRMWREHRVREWLRLIAPFYCVIGAMLLMFVIGRVGRTGEMTSNAAYQPHAGIAFWLTNVTGYLNVLLYRYVHLSEAAAAITLFAMLALAVALRNRAMLFGWLYFVVAITPVALISLRQGYVLYVPMLGLGLYCAALAGLAVSHITPRIGESAELASAEIVILGVLTAFLCVIHISHWPAQWVVTDSPHWRLTDKMRRDYPAMKSGAKILFVDDFPIQNGYDLLFNLRLLYHDPLIEVFRLKGPAVQQPDRNGPWNFDHVFTTGADAYVELDRRNVEESIKFNILQDYATARFFDPGRADSVAYVVSGVLTSGGRQAGWWTERTAKLKFDVYPADSNLTLKWGVPEYVAAGGKRLLSVVVDGETVGTVALVHVGDNSATFRVPARAINPSGFTVLELNVDNPYARDGREYGVVLQQAGFDYAKP